MPWTCWGGEGPAAGAGIVLGKAAAWLHRHRGDAVVDEAEAGYVRSAGEGRLHRLDIAQAHRDCDVARDVLVHQRRAWRYRVLPVVIPPFVPYRKADHRDLLLSGLRLAAHGGRGARSSQGGEFAVAQRDVLVLDKVVHRSHAVYAPFGPGGRAGSQTLCWRELDSNFPY